MFTIQEKQSESEIACAQNTTEPPMSPMFKPLNTTHESHHVEEPPLELQWPPPTPVSSHTINLRLNMMNQDPKDLHTARAIIEELRSKVRFQTEHIIKWRKAYDIQLQQHYRYQKEKADQMNALTSQLLLLESRLKRKQKQIASLLNHRELTIQRQQKIIDDLGICTETTNDSDSAIVLEDIDFDYTLPFGRRKNNGGNCLSSDEVTITRSISDAIETNLMKYGGNRRSNCFLRRPDILETVYSVEEDSEPQTDLAEKRDKFKNRSEKALGSTESQLVDHGMISSVEVVDTKNNDSNGRVNTVITTNDVSVINNFANESSCTTYSIKVPKLPNADPERGTKSQVTNFNRVMCNHRSVNKPKDVKYKRINKAKSKSLEELRGRLKNLVERGTAIDGTTMTNNGYPKGILPHTAQSLA